MSKLGKKIVIICIVIILCVLVYLLVPTINKINLMKKYVKTYNEYFESDNYKYSYEHDNGYGEIQNGAAYFKGDKGKSIVTVITDEEETTSVSYATKNSAICVDDDKKTFYITSRDSFHLGLMYIKTTSLVYMPENLDFFGKCKYVWNSFSYVHALPIEKVSIFSKLKAFFR